MDQPIRRADAAETKGKRGRPKGAIGAPRRGDLEALLCLFDLMQYMGFDDALRMMREINFGGILKHAADRTTHPKRLRRWADRYQRKSDVVRLLMARASAAEERPSILDPLMLPVEGRSLPIPEQVRPDLIVPLFRAKRA